MKEFRGRGSERGRRGGFRSKRKEETKKSLEEDTKSSLSSEDLSNDVAAPSRSCASPAKSEDSEGGNATDLSASSSSQAGGNSSNYSKQDQYDSSSAPNKKQTLSKIAFQPGIRLEAKDLGNEVWYAVRVVEVDWEEEEILIHFEKWSQRYDEWIPMDSSRLRPIQEPPSTSSKKNSKVFKVGDFVMATWTDSRKYPAKVVSVLSNDKYEVLFYDGFLKNIKGIRMSKMKESDMLNLEQFPEKLGGKYAAKPRAPPVLSPLVTDCTDTIGTKADRRERKRKLNVAELFHFKKRSRMSSKSPSSPMTPLIVKRKRGGRRRKLRPEIPPQEDQPQDKSDISKNKLEVEEEEEKKKEKKEKSRAATEPGPSTDKLTVEEESTQPAVPVEEEEKKHEEPVPVPVEGKPRRKIIPKYKDTDMYVKPRRRSRGVEGDGSGKPVTKRNTVYKMRGFGRKRNKDGREPASTTEEKDTNKVESSEETRVTETPRAKKKEHPEGETHKPPKKSALDSWEPEGEPAYIVESSEGLRKSIIVLDKRLPEGWIKHMIQRMGGHSAGKWDVFFVCPQGRKFRSRHELRNYFEEKGEEFNREQFDFSLGRRKNRWANRESSAGKSTSPSVNPAERAPDKIPRPGFGRGKSHFIPGGGDSSDQPVRRVKTLLPKVRVPQPGHSDELGLVRRGSNGPPSPPPPYTTTVATTPAVIVGGLKIQMENDAFVCPKEGCNKHFRKENLLQMHIKHYHPEYNKFMGSTPNVADLAYARTIGEPVEDLMPKARYGVGSSAFLEKINRFEANRKAKSASLSAAPSTSASPGIDCSPVDRKKLLGPVTSKKIKSEFDARPQSEESMSDSILPREEKTTGSARANSPPISEIPMTLKEERKEQPTIKTLLPVVRTLAPSQELTLAERLKMRFPHEEGESRLSLPDISPRKDLASSPQQQHQQPSQLVPQQATPSANTQPPLNQTKSMRTVKRKYMSDFHMEPLMKKRKTVRHLDMVPEDVDTGEEGSLHSDGSLSVGKTPPAYRFSRKKAVVHLEKLQVTTDSTECEERSKSPLVSATTSQPTETAAKTRVEQLRREEIINCTCGFSEEDGLMIQCDLCLCWQHGLCNNIEKETDVPEKYVCPICLNPPRERMSKHYIHDQDWLKEGTLPALSFRSKNTYNLSQREAILKRSHDLTGTLLQLDHVINSLRVKVNIAGHMDHQKLYLWSKSWDKNDSESTPQTQSQSFNQDMKMPSSSLHGGGQSAKSEQQKVTTEQPSTLNVHSEGIISVKSRLEGKEHLSKSRTEEQWNDTSMLSSKDLATTLQDDDCNEEERPKFPALGRQREAVKELCKKHQPVLSDDDEQCEITPVEECVESVAEDGDTKDSVTSVDSSNVVEEAANANLAKTKIGRKITETNKEESSDTANAIIMESSLDIQTETEVATEVEGAQEEVVESNKDDDDDDDGKLRTEGNILHQALTNGIQAEDSATPQHLLQLQSELMRFASSMADNLGASEPPRPRAPQPEAPIDPVECRVTLLDHIENYHQQIDSRLTSLEAQIAALESLDPHLASDEAADYYPQTKQTIVMLLRDLQTVRRIAVLP